MPKGDRLRGKADIEDGWYKVSNYLSEALAYSKLSSTKLRILEVLKRHTYGWHRKTTPLSIEFFRERMRGSSASFVACQLRELARHKVIERWRSGNQRYRYTINTNISQWDPKVIDFCQYQKIISKGDRKLSPTGDTKLPPEQPSNPLKKDFWRRLKTVLLLKTKRLQRKQP